MIASRSTFALAATVLAISVGCGSGPGEVTTAAPDGDAPAETAADALVMGPQVYGDALGAGWSDGSSAARDLANASPVYSGARSISVDFGPRTTLHLRHAGLSAAALTHLELRVNGGSVAGKALLVYATVGGAERTRKALAPYCNGGTIRANAWTRCRVPIADLGVAGATIDGLVVEEAAGQSLSRTYFDAIGFLGRALSVSVSVSPATATVAPGGAVAFAAAVSGGSNGAVTWSVQEPSGCGTVTAAGVYTAPPNAATCHVVATSVADPSRSATATATVVASQQTVRVTATPSSAGVRACRTLALTATVTGTADTGVTWSMQEGAAGGTVTAAGLYTAPTSAGVYHAIATSRADPAARAAVTLSVTDEILGVEVAPGSVTVAPGGQVLFTATVTTSCGAFTTTRTAPN